VFVDGSTGESVQPVQAGGHGRTRRALVAVMHRLTIAISHVLHDTVTHHDLGADYFAGRAMRAMTRHANLRGPTIAFAPIGP
jgi:hypothetical protein